MVLMKDDAFKFNNECLEDFSALKNTLISTPIMQHPNQGAPFEIMCEASDYTVGAVLGQKKDNKMNSIYYTRGNLDEAQFNYATTEK